MAARMSRAGAIRLSIVVVTYNSRAAVAVSLPALAAQMGPDDELVVVDNDSADDTLAVVRGTVPEAAVGRPGHTAGFAAGPTRGAAPASGDLLLFLNPDATPAAGFTEAIRAP